MCAHDQVFSFGQVRFEMFPRHLGGAVERAVRYMHSESGIEVELQMGV